MGNILVWWGAVLSTVLAVIKIWELWLARQRIEADAYFGVESGTSNKIIIRNLSDKPIIVVYCELLFRERKGWKWITYGKRIPYEDLMEVDDFCIDAYSSKELNFSGDNYFEWGHKILDGKRLYISLDIAGKSKPIERLVYEG